MPNHPGRRPHDIISVNGPEPAREGTNSAEAGLRSAHPPPAGRFSRRSATALLLGQGLRPRVVAKTLEYSQIGTTLHNCNESAQAGSVRRRTG